MLTASAAAIQVNNLELDFKISSTQNQILYNLSVVQHRKSHSQYGLQSLFHWVAGGWLSKHCSDL